MTVKVRDGTVEMLFGFDILINGVVYPNNIESDLRIDRTVLEDEFASQTRIYAYYATLAALAKDQEAKLKRISELVYATSDHNAREEARLLAEGGDKRKFTEKIFETMSKTNQDYQKAQMAYLNAKHLADKLTKIEHAFAQRKEMLISLGAHARVGSSDPKVLGANYRSDVQQRREEIKEEIVELGEPKEEPKEEQQIAQPTTTRKRRRKTKEQ